MMKKKSLILLAIILSIGILSGCSFVRIQNVSENTVTDLVNTPDSGKAYTRTIRGGQIVDVFSANGGRYTVTMIPTERYKDTLYTLQQQISNRLFEERATLTADQVATLVKNLNTIDQAIKDLAKPMPSCSGYLPDFDTVVVIIALDYSTGNYEVSCSSGEG